MATLRPFSPKDCHSSWGSVIFEGYADDTMVRFTRNSDVTSRKVGADGSNAISVIPDVSGTVEVTLFGSSKSNREMSAILAAQELKARKSDIYIKDFVTVDPSGSAIAVLRNAVIKGTPVQEIGMEQSSYTWTLEGDNMQFLSIPKGVDPSEVLDSVGVVASMEALNRI